MPFLDSETIRPLYDIHNGGPPRAFECKLSRYPTIFNPCGHVTRTLMGMISHQKQVHDFCPQADLEHLLKEETA